MPQDKRKSISYRSFVTCDNPKGVVECGSIRKCKINSQKLQQQSFKVDVGEKKLGIPITTNTSLGVIKEDKKKMCIQEITREELVDVSKGGDKMNHVINSWSKGKGDQDEIAKGLLRGAFDLQESIVMLGKLQEEAFSSLNMSRSRQKEKHKVEEGTFDCMVNGVTNEKLQMGFQRSRKSTDEMKKVVRDSLLRQNMITNPIFEENYDHRMMHFSDMPSTSSSQSSSRVRSSNFVPSDSSSSSTISQRRKKKDSNLIVKLMGLESPPLSPRWHIEGEKIVNLPRKGQYGAQLLGKKQRSVEEILESLHFKGLLKSSSMNGRTTTSVESEVFSLENGFFDERPPIVIMKPICNPHRDVEESIIPKFWLEGIMKPSRDHEVFSHFSEQGNKNSIKKVPKPRTKNEAPRKSIEIEKISPSIRKEEVNKDARCHDQEKSANAPKLIKQKDGRLISKQHNVSSNSIFDHRKQEICEISGQQRKNRHSAFVEEKKKGKGKEKQIEAVYRKDVSNYDSSNVLPVVKSMIFDSFIKQDKPINQIRDYNIESSADYRLNDKMPIYDITLADTHGYDDSNSCYSEITSVSTSELNYSPVCEVTLVTTHENGIPVNNHSNKSPSLPYEPEVSQEMHHETPPRTRLQTLLFSNPSFLNTLEELFEIQVFPKSAPYDVGKDRVLIEYANEVLHLKKSELSQPYLPQTWKYPKKARNLPSLDQILEEIRNDIESMKDYHGSARDDKFSSDNLYLILDQDLRLKSGTWESGWKRMLSQDEVELVVRDVDKLILGKLIEEVVLEFMVL